MVNPNPFTPQELDAMRTYMMVPKVFATPHALLEGIFEGINGLYDDPTDQGATQAAIRVTLGKLAALEANLNQLEGDLGLLLGSEIEGEIKFDAARQVVFLREISGPALITQLASRLAFTPDDEYFSPSKILPGRSISYREPRYNRR